MGVKESGSLSAFAIAVHTPSVSLFLFFFVRSFVWCYVMLYYVSLAQLVSSVRCRYLMDNNQSEM